jgi:putative transposase
MVFGQKKGKPSMKKTRHTTERIIRILREAEVSERSNEEICRQHNIRKYGGMDLKEAQRLRQLERENSELKKLLADQLLKTKALEIALEKNI